jgi:hypothetical protein
MIVMAKAPAPGHTKTRMCPPLRPREAAALAQAALADTLETVASTVAPAARVLALEGEPGDWLPPGFRVIRQRGVGLAARLASAFDDVGGATLLIGMDTPQVRSSELSAALEMLISPEVDALLGPAPDGGYWAIGLRAPDERVFASVPMSSRCTLAAQRARLDALGLRWRELPSKRDADTFADALEVAREAPGSRFAVGVEAALAAMTRERAA